MIHSKEVASTLTPWFLHGDCVLVGCRKNRRGKCSSQKKCLTLDTIRKEKGLKFAVWNVKDSQ